jgi:hypothetical protein
MIKIDDHAANLDAQAGVHYETVNPRNQPRRGQAIGDYNHWSLIRRIQRGRDAAVAQTEIDFWNYLLVNNEANLKLLISGRPNVLQSQIAAIEQQFTRALFSNDISYTDAELTPFGLQVQDAFAYEALYRSKDVCVTNFRLFNLKHCPYCNVFPVQVVSFQNLQGTTRHQALHQLDHFYPQSRHPYLALSFFNMVPACWSCNAVFKLQKRFAVDTHFNPFDHRLDEEFEFRVNTVAPQNAAELIFSREWRNGSVYSEQALTDFQLMPRYNESEKINIFDMIQHFRNYGPAVSLSQMQQIPELFDNELAQHNSLLKAMHIPAQPIEINDYSLGKLKRDICLRMEMA